MRGIRLKPSAAKRIIVLLDWENLMLSSIPATPDDFSVAAGLEKIDRDLRDIGEVVGVFAFGPYHSLVPYLDLMFNYQIFPILCEKIRTKTGDIIDTADTTLIEFGRKMIDNIKGLTHICIGSGDRDFITFCKIAQRVRLIIILVAGKPRTLSKELVKLVDKYPDTGEKMILHFLPKNISSHPVQERLAIMSPPVLSLL